MKRWIKVMIVVALVMSMQVNAVYADTNKSGIEECVEDYVTQLVMMQEHNSKATADPEDYESIEGYIIAKAFVNKRDCYSYISAEGIHDLSIEDIEISKIDKIKDHYDVAVVVSYRYLFNGDVECKAACLYRVKVVRDGVGFRCADIYTRDDDNVYFVTDGLEYRGIVEYDDQLEYVDDYFDDLYEVMYSQPRQNVNEHFRIAEEEPEEEQELLIDGSLIDSVNSTTVSYYGSKAATYGEKYGGVTQNYIFRRTNLDCTNFVSQCVWAGYGGTNGYTLPTTPTHNNATITALRNRVANNYRMTSAWYGRNYDSSNTNDPPAKWCGVVEFYNHVTGNSGNGPKGTGYNNGNPASDLGDRYIQRGNVIQKYSTSLGRYSHSVMVVSETPRKITASSMIYVAQHTADYSSRSLYDLLGNGNMSTKIRLLVLGQTTFSE